MAFIIRFFSRRFGKKKTEPTPSHVDEIADTGKTKKVNKSDLDCRVSYLDGTEQTFYLPMWMDGTKGIRKQCKTKPPYNIALRVKFFASDPQNLHDEYTRYLVVLQLREDMQSGRLPCHDLRLATELASLLLQSEFGDFDPKQHTAVFVSTFRYLPVEQQTEDFELGVLNEYRALSNRNMTPADAESLYLQKACILPDYGVDMHTVKGKTNQDYQLGLTPSGILVYEGSDKIGLFYWPSILKIEMNGRRLKILVSQEDEKSRAVIEHAFCFTLPDKRQCKSLWKSAIEHHSFFRLTDRNKPPPKRGQLFRLGSRFHATFNTEYQLHNLNVFGSSSLRRKRNKGGGSTPSTPNQPRAPMESNNNAPANAMKSSSFRRIPSKRFNSRPSFIGRSFDDRRARRHQAPAESRDPTKEDVFNRARTVVSVERACLNDITGRPASPPNRTPTLRPRVPPPPLPFGANAAGSDHIPVTVRVTPGIGASGRRAAPNKPPRRFDSARPPMARAECFEATV